MDEIVSIIVIFFGLSFLSFATFKNSAIGLIKEIGICKSLYPKHYIAPARWMRKMYKIRQSYIPIFLYVELAFSLVILAFGVINSIISIIVVMKTGDKGIAGVLVIIHASFPILNLFYLVIMLRTFRKSERNNHEN